MKTVKFHFKLESAGRLEYVKFFPEESEDSIVITPDANRKVWENKGFEVEVSNPFQYVLSIAGASDTTWKASLKIIDGDEEHDFLSWEGRTGDTSKNLSRRTTPIKNI
jgi:hypothetical protein